MTGSSDSEKGRVRRRAVQASVHERRQTTLALKGELISLVGLLGQSIRDLDGTLVGATLGFVS